MFRPMCTQDIAVDGLALTVLSERNKELGATCNAIGQTLGYFLSYVGFLALNHYGVTDLAGFMAFWGW
jgi:PAT family acetyl-CoA transporter-like MFS transporter 1